MCLLDKIFSRINNLTFQARTTSLQKKYSYLNAIKKEHMNSLFCRKVVYNLPANIFILGIFVFIRIPLAKPPKTGEKNVVGSSQLHMLRQRRNMSRCATKYIDDKGEEDGKYDVTSLHGKRLEDVPNFDCVDEIDADQLTDFNTFKLSYMLKNRPVIIRNLARKQKAFNMWTDSYLIRRFENELLTIETKTNEDREAPKTSMSIERFLQQMRERPDELYAAHTLQNLGMKRDLALPSFLILVVGKYYKTPKVSRDLRRRPCVLDEFRRNEISATHRFYRQYIATVERRKKICVNSSRREPQTSIR